MSYERFITKLMCSGLIMAFGGLLIGMFFDSMWIGIAGLIGGGLSEGIAAYLYRKNSKTDGTTREKGNA